MIGRILFLTAAAYAGYLYIRRSNRKAQQISQPPGTVEILPPEPASVPAARATETALSAAVQPVRQLRAPVMRSRASEPDPNR